MNLPGAPLQYVRDIWQGILNELRRVDAAENAKVDRANRFVGAQTIAAALDIQQQLAVSGDITPAQITASQNDYNPSGLLTASTLRLSSDASRNITGLVGGSDGRVVFILNVGTNAIVLTNADVLSSAANRFQFSANITLNADQSAVLQYDATSSRWRCIGKS